jgi:Icc-related predicted phosphoesterase
MSRQHVNRILCAGQPGGSPEAVERLLAVAEDEGVQATALIGELAGSSDDFRLLFRRLARASHPVFWIPGPGDAPADRYLRESYNIEVAFPLLRGVHGTAAFTPEDNVVFAGMGGEISDDPDTPRDERERLRYPRWEAEYRLKVLGLLDYNELVMLFASAPAHKGRNVPGSDAVAELVGTYRPRLVVCGGERGIELLGKSLVVAPGLLSEGHYAVADLHARTAEPGELSVAAQ